MRALRPLVLSLALLAGGLGAAGAAFAASCPARACVDQGYPGPGVHATIWEKPGCEVHQIFWEGAWMSVADASVWIASGATAFPADRLDDRAGQAFLLAYTHAFNIVNGATPRVPGWLGNPIAGLDWTNAQLGHEDECALTFADVRTGP